jgi:CRP-like cAMP-binding protein
MLSLKKLLDDPKFVESVPFSVEKFKANDIILEEDDEGRDFYLITQGEVQVKTYLEGKVEGKTSGLTKLGPDDLFGELSLFDGEPRSAQVTALTDCELIRFHGLSMILYLDNHPEEGYFVLRDMFTRLVFHMRQNTVRTKTILQLYLSEQAV